MAKDILSSFNDPKQLELLKEINLLKEEIRNCSDETKKEKMRKRLNEVEMHFNILSERKNN